MAKQMAFYFDQSSCTGCKACAIACKDRSSLPVGINWRKVYDYGGGGWNPDNVHPEIMVQNNVFMTATSTACMHCQSPACVAACPAKAITKRDDGIVLIDANVCIGCRYCEWACPYGAPQFNTAKGVMTKCDFCQDLQAQGLNPVCVDACPMRALGYGELNDLMAAHGTVNAVEPLPVSSITNPSIVITPHKHSQPSGTGTGHIVKLDEV